MSTELFFLSARELAQQIRTRKLSAVDVVEAHFRRIDELNPRLNAFVELRRDAAISEAREAERRVLAGDHAPLLGVPISIKSCIEVGGSKCEAGSRLREGQVGATDARLVRRLKAAGAIVVGLTNTPEFLMAYATDNALYGRTSNPWDARRSSGGSSGGESAAIAAGMSAAGIGSDGGGSIRVPAHFTGICGLKPTPGRIPGTGHVPACVGPFAWLGVVGPMARSVADLHTMLQVTSGADDGDPMAGPFEPVGELEHFPRLLRTGAAGAGLKVGIIDDKRCTPETSAAVRAAADVLQAAGAIVEPFVWQGFGEAEELWELLFCRGGAMALAPLTDGRAADLSPGLRDFLAYATARPPLQGPQLLDTLFRRDVLRANFLARMQEFPLLLSPVSTVPAFEHGAGGWGTSHRANYIETMRYTQWFNLLGNPAAVLPVGQSPEGLPIGVQVIGRPFDEALVLSAAEQIERAYGFKAPPLDATRGGIDSQ